MSNTVPSSRYYDEIRRAQGLAQDASGIYAGLGFFQSTGPNTVAAPRVSAAAKLTTQIAEVTLTLDRNAAETLLAVVENIAGKHGTTRRQHTNAIRLALESAGVNRDTVAVVGQLSFPTETIS